MNDIREEVAAAMKIDKGDKSEVTMNDGEMMVKKKKM